MCSKTQAKMCISRIKLMRNKRQIGVSGPRGQRVPLIVWGQLPSVMWSTWTYPAGGGVLSTVMLVCPHS